MAPNIMNNINFLNKVSAWIIYNILAEEATKKRGALLKQVIDVLFHLLELRSYNMMTSVNAALGNSAIYRLSQTWELVDDDAKEDIESVRISDHS
jgi:hypothetical protein